MPLHVDLSAERNDSFRPCMGDALLTVWGRDSRSVTNYLSARCFSMPFRSAAARRLYHGGICGQNLEGSQNKRALGGESYALRACRECEDGSGDRRHDPPSDTQVR